MGILRGIVTFSERSRSRRWSADLGWQTVIEYVGPSEELEANVEAAKIGATEVSVMHSTGPISTLTVTYGNQQTDESNEETTAFWELVAEDIQHDIWDAPGFSRFGAEDKTKFQKALADYESGVYKPVSEYKFSASVVDDVSLLLSIASVAKSYTTESWVLRKTQVIGSYPRVRFNLVTNSPIDLDVTLNGVGRVLTTAQVIATEPALPSSIVGALNAYPVQPAKQGFLWGWLKRIPTLTTKAGNKLDAVQEFRMGYFPKSFYLEYA